MTDAPHNPNPGQMAETEDESARVKGYLDGASVAERQRISREYPLEFDEWATEQERRRALAEPAP